MDRNRLKSGRPAVVLAAGLSLMLAVIVLTAGNHAQPTALEYVGGDDNADQSVFASVAYGEDKQSAVHDGETMWDSIKKMNAPAHAASPSGGRAPPPGIPADIFARFQTDKNNAPAAAGASAPPNAEEARRGNGAVRQEQRGIVVEPLNAKEVSKERLEAKFAAEYQQSMASNGMGRGGGGGGGGGARHEEKQVRGGSMRQSLEQEHNRAMTADAIRAKIADLSKLLANVEAAGGAAPAPAAPAAAPAAAHSSPAVGGKKAGAASLDEGGAQKQNLEDSGALCRDTQGCVCVKAGEGAVGSSDRAFHMTMIKGKGNEEKCFYLNVVGTVGHPLTAVLEGPSGYHRHWAEYGQVYSGCIHTDGGMGSIVHATDGVTGDTGIFGVC